MREKERQRERKMMVSKKKWRQREHWGERVKRENERK